MWFAHMGWIFWKSEYPRMPTIGREDLDRDPSQSLPQSLTRCPDYISVVRFQHRHYGEPTAHRGGSKLMVCV